jgi:hypothetical protein
VAPAADPARRFRRSAWPDVIIVFTVVALGATGALALWGDDFLHRSGSNRDLPVEQAPPSAGGT